MKKVSFKLIFFYSSFLILVFASLALLLSAHLQNNSLESEQVWFYSLAALAVTLIVSLSLWFTSANSLSETMRAMDKTLKGSMDKVEGERAKLNAILETMKEGVIAVDKQKRVLLLNQSLQKMLGLESHEYLGKSLLEVVKNSRMDEMMEEARKKSETITDELEITLGQPQTLKVHAISVENQESDVSGILVVHDVSDLRQLQRMRQDFVANVSHELKTPLTSIKGFIETLLSDESSDQKKAQKFLKIMQDDTERLSRLIHDLLELSKLDSGKLDLVLEATQISKEVDQVLSIFESQIARKQVKVICQYGEDNVSMVNVDRDRLKQVLMNLIDNAIKFSPPQGIVTITIATEGAFLRVSVQDEGPGIPEEAQPRIFERFFRVDKARSRELGGTGLGLAIAKNIIEAHGGEINCRSKPDKGAELFFTLPILSAPTHTA